MWEFNHIHGTPLTEIAQLVKANRLEDARKEFKKLFTDEEHIKGELEYVDMYLRDYIHQLKRTQKLLKRAIEGKEGPTGPVDGNDPEVLAARGVNIRLYEEFSELRITLLRELIPKIKKLVDEEVTLAE